MVASSSSMSPSPARYGQNKRARQQALALAIILHVAFALLLILQKAAPVVVMAQSSLKAFALEANSGEQQDKVQKKAEKRTETKQDDTPVTPPPAEPPPLPEPPVVKDFQMPFIQMSRQDFAASDIARLPSHRVAAAGQQDDSKAAYGPGAGPGGATLFPADWLRPPTDAELGGYLKSGQPSRGWGQIACRTVAKFHVEDCYIMGESPMGSGFGRSVLNAAWQFLVLPPRINGRSQVGTWVSIKIIYGPEGSQTGAAN